jgi:1-deoxy-D-xylulose-5-phosphate synthase
LLNTINDPRELRQLDRGNCATGAGAAAVSARFGEPDRRASVIESGTVELTIALHYVFDTPHDRLVWDVVIRPTAYKC